MLLLISLQEKLNSLACIVSRMHSRDDEPEDAAHEDGQGVEGLGEGVVGTQDEGADSQEQNGADDGSHDGGHNPRQEDGHLPDNNHPV